MNSSPESPKPKKSRNRKAASCNPCRARKLRCSRSLPCESCQSKGHPELCIWDADSAPPLYEARERNETESLRHEVDRLQSLISVLIESKNSPPSRQQHSFPSPSYVDSIRSFGGAGPTSSERRDEPKDEDLAAHDLAQKLGHLAIKAFHVGTDKDNTDPLVKEARDLLDGSANSCSSTNFILNSPQPAAAFSVFPFARSQATTLEILARLPSRAQADAAARFYFINTDWYMHMVPAYIFTQHAEQVWLAQARGTPADAFSLAIVFAVWAVGLFGMSANKSAASGLPSTLAAKDALANEWLELSSSALAAGRFLERPTLEAIRALLLLATHYVALSPGDNGGAGIAYLVLTMQCCVQLKMHRDPEKSPGRYSAGEAEDRRRVFWQAFLAAQTATTTYGRKTSMLHLSDIDTKLPSDIGDELMGSGRGGDGGETMMTSLIVRINIAKLAEQISDEVFGIQPVSYSQVLDFDRQVSQLEADVFPHYRYSSISSYDIQKQPIRALRSYMIQLAICQERLRLHRPYLARSYVDETFAYSRTMCLHAAKQILEMQATVICQAPWSGLQYKSCQSAIIFCIDLLYSPYGSQAASQRAMVDGALRTMDKFAKISTLCRRGGKVIRFMLAKLPPNSPASRSSSQMEHPSQAKRTRTDSDPRASHQSQHSNSPTYAHSLDGQPSAAEEALPRKIPTRSTSSSSFIPTSSIYPSPPLPAPSSLDKPPNHHALQLTEELGSFDFNAMLGLGGSTSAPSPPFGSSFGSSQSGFSLFPPQHTPSPPVFRPTIGSKTSSATSFDFGAAPVPNGLVGPGAPPLISEKINPFATSNGQRSGSGTPIPRLGGDVKPSSSEGFVFGGGLDGVVAGEEYFNPLGLGMIGVQDQQSYAFGGIDAELEMEFFAFGGGASA